ncbi:MAG: hypothetical protein WA886_21015 [Candidatus Acidiferrales bacterium]
MNTDWTSLRGKIRATCLVGVSVYLLGAGVASTTAYTPSANRDVTYSFVTAGDTLTSPPNSPSPAQELTKDETFTNQTDVRDYLFTLDDATRMVHLNIAAEVKHGRVRWELIDPTGATRTEIRTTERASMDTTNIQAIKGEWHLRMTLEDATGSYHVHWVG